LKPGSSASATTLTIATTGSAAAYMWMPTRLVLVSGLMLSVSFLVSVRGPQARRGCAVLVFAILWATLLSCGGNPSQSRTPSGVYIIAITATSAGVSHTSSFPLTVN
jgi:hypothetical protein